MGLRECPAGDDARVDHHEPALAAAGPDQWRGGEQAGVLAGVPVQGGAADGQAGRQDLQDLVGSGEKILDTPAESLVPTLPKPGRVGQPHSRRFQVMVARNSALFFVFPSAAEINVCGRIVRLQVCPLLPQYSSSMMILLI